MRKIGKGLLHPAWFMIGFWTFLYAIYFLAPINQTPPASIAGTAFVISQVLVFCIGSVLGAGGLGCSLLVQAPMTSQSLATPRIPRTMNTFFLIGISGALLSMFIKMLDLDFISLSGFAVLRAERAQQLLEATSFSSSLLSGVGFLTYPAGFIVLVLTLVLYETLPHYTRALSVLYVTVIFLLSIVTGGRSTIFITIIFLSLALYIRHCRGLSTLPRSRLIKFFILLLPIGFIGYSTLIWMVRFDFSGQSSDMFLAHADQAWGVTPTENLEALALALEQPSLVQNVVSNIFYFTQSISIIERILGMSEVPILLGTYHIDIAAAAARVFIDSDFMAQGYATLLDSNVYGFFTSAWGALYIDFGFFGSYIATLLWGVLAGVAHRHARRNIYSDGFTQYVFWTYSIMISFVSPPLGFSNSAVTLIWFILYRALGFFQENARLTRSVPH